MSYEGWEQWVCKNGHYHGFDCWNSPYDHSEWKCPVCGEGVAWWNCVDDTNGNDPGTNWGYGYVELEIDVPAEQCKCDKCGNVHKTTIETYKIPKEEGHFVNTENTEKQGE